MEILQTLTRSIRSLPTTPGYYSEIFNGNVSGPIDKKASFFFTVQQRDIDNVSVVVAQVLGPGNTIVSLQRRQCPARPSG